MNTATLGHHAASRTRSGYWALARRDA